MQPPRNYFSCTNECLLAPQNSLSRGNINKCTYILSPCRFNNETKKGIWATLKVVKTSWNRLYSYKILIYKLERYAFAKLNNSTLGAASSLGQVPSSRSRRAASSTSSAAGSRRSARSDKWSAPSCSSFSAMSSGWSTRTSTSKTCALIDWLLHLADTGPAGQCHTLRGLLCCKCIRHLRPVSRSTWDRHVQPPETSGPAQIDYVPI